MDTLLESHLRFRLEVCERSLDFLEPGSSRNETLRAINTDLYRLYSLRDQLEQLANDDLVGWSNELEAAKVMGAKIRQGFVQTQKLREAVDHVKFPVRETSQPKQGSLVEQQSTTTSFNHENAQTKKSVGASKAPPPVGFPRLAYLTVQEFQSVPKYMKGRFTYDMFNQIVDEFNSALEEKYEFMRKGFQAMASIQDKKRFKEWRSHESKETKGRHFVVADDLKQQPTLKSESNRQKIFTILRHVQRVQEIRGPGSIHRYCVR